jgi:subtilisin family serine protease
MGMSLPGEPPPEPEPGEDGWVNPPIEIHNQQAVTTATQICAQYGATLVETFDGVGSFLATMTETQARAMNHDARVGCVLGDLSMEPGTTQNTPQYNEFGLNEWGIDRIDQNAWPSGRGTFTYTATGAGVHAYVVDSGIWKDHPEFGGRADWVFSALRGKSPNDYFGHGTSVASALGGQRTGTAKGVTLHSIRIGDEHGRTWISTMARAFNYIYFNGHKPGVVNCSYLTRKRGSWLFGLIRGTVGIEKAVKRAIGRGFPVTVCAGNTNEDANRYSPGTVEKAVTVAASTEIDQRADFSNWGFRIDIFAPGDDVFVASWEVIDGVRVYKYIRWGGTSFAAPYVAGVIAQYQQDNPTFTPQNISDWLYANASWARLDPNTLNGSPNRIVFTNR